jgi:hypothetical protein
MNIIIAIQTSVKFIKSSLLCDGSLLMYPC